MAVVQSPYKQAVHMEFYVRCMRCGLQTEVSTIEEIPVAEWNNRMQEDILRERAELAEAERDKYKAALKAIGIGMLMPEEFAKAALDGRWKPVFD
jgi:hypothetical protein